MGLSLEVTEKTSFAELVSRISEDPVMKQILIESKMRQGAMDRKQKRRIASYNASRTLSASTAKSSAKYSQMFAQQCPVGNFVSIMPAAQQFVQVQLPCPQQPLLLPKLPAVPTLRMNMELNNGHVMSDKEKSALSIQQTFCPVPSFPFPDYTNLLGMSSSSSSRSMLINDDPWGEGDFEKVADPHGGYYLLEALLQADKLTDFPSNPQETADDKDKNMLDTIDEEARSHGDHLLEARVDEPFEAVNPPVTTQEADLDNNNKNTQSPNDEDDDIPEALEERPNDYFDPADADLNQRGVYLLVARIRTPLLVRTSKPSLGAYKRKFTGTAWSTWLKRQRRIH